jgi:hypothetical protein
MRQVYTEALERENWYGYNRSETYSEKLSQNVHIYSMIMLTNGRVHSGFLVLGNLPVYTKAISNDKATMPATPYGRQSSLKHMNNV